MNLPSDLLEEIIEYLNDDDIKIFHKVCAQFCKIINYNKCFCPKNIDFADDQIYNFKKLDLNNCRDFDDKIILRFKNLIYLDLGESYNITDDGLTGLNMLKIIKPGRNVNVTNSKLLRDNTPIKICKCIYKRDARGYFDTMPEKWLKNNGGGSSITITAILINTITRV